MVGQADSNDGLESALSRRSPTHRLPPKILSLHRWMIEEARRLYFPHLVHTATGRFLGTFDSFQCRCNEGYQTVLRLRGGRCVLRQSFNGFLKWVALAE